MIKYAEKRDFLRMPIDCEMYFLQRGDDTRYQGHVINLSSKGILFTSQMIVVESAALEITLTPGNAESSPMEFSAVVTRVSDNESIFEIACEIEEFS
jgi:hypothetical protein